MDWGDGTKKDFNIEPMKIDENTAVYHTYETSGIFEVTGTMIRMKPDKDYKPMGVISNKRFRLFINVNEALDEDFLYFGTDGFSFIPYRNTLPVVGGYSEQSIYYKSIKRQLGILTDDLDIKTSFKSLGDRLKTEIALDKMDSSYSGGFDLLNEYKKERVDSDGTTIYNGVKTFSNELGKSIGDGDITNIRYFNKPLQLWRFLGLETTSRNLGIIGLNYDSMAGCRAVVGGSDNGTPHDFTDDITIPEIGFTDYNTWPGSENLRYLGNAVCDSRYFCSQFFGYPEESFMFQTYQGEATDPVHNRTYNTLDCILADTVQPHNSEDHPSNPSSIRYWKNIIPEDYSIFNRNGINSYIDSDGELQYSISETISDTTQTWKEDDNGNVPYYPVLPIYGPDGRFIFNEYPEGTIPFPLEGPITDESFNEEALKISINRRTLESNVFDDFSGNNNYGFAFTDYKPQFEEETLKPKKIKTAGITRYSKFRGAF